MYFNKFSLLILLRRKEKKKKQFRSYIYLSSFMKSWRLIYDKRHSFFFLVLFLFLCELLQFVLPQSCSSQTQIFLFPLNTCLRVRVCVCVCITASSNLIPNSNRYFPLIVIYMLHEKVSRMNWAQQRSSSSFVCANKHKLVRMHLWWPTEDPCGNEKM